MSRPGIPLQVGAWKRAVCQDAGGSGHWLFLKYEKSGYAAVTEHLLPLLFTHASGRMLLTNLRSVQWWQKASKESIKGLPLNMIGNSWKVISGGMVSVCENLLSCDTWHAMRTVPQALDRTLSRQFLDYDWRSDIQRE